MRRKIDHTDASQRHSAPAHPGPAFNTATSFPPSMVVLSTRSDSSMFTVTVHTWGNSPERELLRVRKTTRSHEFDIQKESKSRAAPWYTEQRMRQTKTTFEEGSKMARKSFPAPPDRKKTLFEAIFEIEEGAIPKILSDGIKKCIRNAGWLIEDAKLLAGGKRYARASFLVHTSHEEAAKAYILLDMCRLDFKRHQSELRALCKAFYGHVEKHAYYETLKNAEVVPERRNPYNFRDMESLKRLFESDLQRWWPGDEEGFPDLPHDTYFNRELRLYVDYQENEWYLPNPDDQSHHLIAELLGDESEFLASKPLLDTLCFTRDQKLFEPDILWTYNSVHKGFRVKSTTTFKEIGDLHTKIAVKLHNVHGTDIQTYWRSSLSFWPLYFCL